MISPIKMRIRVTLNEPILGTSPNNPDIAREYIASKAPDAKKMEEEVAALGADAVAEKGMTVFPRTAEGEPFLWDYQLKGFFKDAAGGLRRMKGTVSESIKAYKSVLDTVVFVQPRQVVLHMEGGMGDCQRPLRASTPQGERVTLANSEEAPAGSWLEFDILYWPVKGLNMEEWLTEMLDYGQLRGLGQWRNSGKGRFSWQEITE